MHSVGHSIDLRSEKYSIQLLLTRTHFHDAVCTPLPARYGIPCHIQCAPYREGRCGVLCRRKAWMKEFRPDEMKWKDAHTHTRGHVYMYVTAVRRKRRPG